MTSIGVWLPLYLISHIVSSIFSNIVNQGEIHSKPIAIYFWWIFLFLLSVICQFFLAFIVPDHTMYSVIQSLSLLKVPSFFVFQSWWCYVFTLWLWYTQGYTSNLGFLYQVCQMHFCFTVKWCVYGLFFKILSG